MNHTVSGNVLTADVVEEMRLQFCDAMLDFTTQSARHIVSVDPLAGAQAWNYVIYRK